jgi:PAS domain S-box-containing protein
MKIDRWYETGSDIEAFDETEEKLREYEPELRRIIDAIPQCIAILDPSGAVLYVNQTTLDYFGLTARELLGPHSRERLLHPDDVERIRNERRAALARGLPFEFEQRALAKDGQYRWFMVRYNPFRDEQGRLVRWIASDTYIDDLKRAEAKLRQDEEELRRMTDAIPHTIIVLDPDGRAIYANRVTLEYTGLSLAEVRADEFRARVFHPDDVQTLRDERHRALSSSLPFETEQRALGQDGKYRWFLIRYHPLLDEAGTVIRWYATGTDIDDRKRILGAHLLQKYAGLRNPPAVSVGGLGPWQKRRATELLRENLAGRIRLSHVAQECGLSVSHFARSFKATFGVSTHRWLVQRRIERSQELLIHTLDSLADIADLAGFADQAAFTRTFHQIVGISPGRWRRDHQRR